MTFRTPSVRVYQELVTTSISPSTPFMDLYIVGPVYQVESGVDAADYTLTGNDYVSKYPNFRLGAKLDTSSVQIKLSDVYVKVWPANEEVIFGALKINNEGPVTTVTGTTQVQLSDAKLKVGDILELFYETEVPSEGSESDETKKVILPYSTTIRSITEDGMLIVLNRNMPDPLVDAQGKHLVYGRIKRPIHNDVILEPQFVIADEDKFTIISGAKVATTVEENDDLTVETASPVVSAKVAVSYRALRTDIANDAMTITSFANAQAVVGTTHISNPMSVAASMVSSAVGDLTYKILPIESDDKNGYLKALDVLSTMEKVYVIVPLTTDKDVLSAYANHCKAMSEPEKSKWRICYGNMEMPSTKVMIEYNNGQLFAGLQEGQCFLKDTANGMFITSMVRPSDFVDVYDAANKYQYSLQVLEVLNETVASCGLGKWERTSEGYVETTEKLVVENITDINYEVVRVLDTQGIAEAVSEVAQSFKNKRFRYVQPDQIMLNINSVDELCPAYYLCVALGAMRAGLPPHQGFSTMGISGIKRVLRANKMFTEDQLAEMAGNGVFWVCQDEPEELPYVLYQTTTDNTQLETAEDSIVAVIDYASKYYKDNLRNVLGKYNVNTISTNYVKAVINSCSDDMTSTNYEYIGPILTSATLVSVETIADKIRPTIKIEVPYPVNAVDVILQV